ncbi:thiolase family protein [Frankia sp. Cj5]|uniref:thiolase C-terminal domain-containing protein n=1 Tax=Frankia sp. Cj5 TaxID=2880978 RepID=UPI001EF44671|nr:thiolase family protein [Frankia sp. Cj5]
MTRYPVKDKVAFAGTGATAFSRDSGERSQLSLCAEACTRAIEDAGLTAADIDGIAGAVPIAYKVQSALGIPETTWWTSPPQEGSFVQVILEAMNAVYSGACNTVIAYHTFYRLPWASRAAAKDPFRRMLSITGGVSPAPEDVWGSVGYTAWASRYLYEYGASREDFGLVAVNSRSNAGRNPNAVMRSPIGMDDYLAARMIRWPLSLLDMDVPIDGAVAFVITTAERARDLPGRPVLIHAATAGVIDRNEEDQTPGLRNHGQRVTVETLRARSDLWLDDMDVYYPYDGFSFITLSWLEAIGLCGPGEAGAFIRDNWDDKTNSLVIHGRVPVNTHGGSLSEGGTQGAGHIREAVLQLRGEAGERQVPGAGTAILTPGGFFFNAHGLVLRAE